MNRLLSLLPLIAVTMAGCASRADLDARYDASLQHWKGATRAELEAAWGKPLLVETADGGTAVTWVTHNDLDSHQGADAAPTVVARSGGGGGAPSVAVIQGMPAAPVVPITCTTRFLLKDGRVVSWKFAGLGCGAPF